VSTKLDLAVANPLGALFSFSGAVSLFGSTSYCSVQVGCWAVW
jgi:hypothetical protein